VTNPSYCFVMAHKPCHCTSHVKVFTTKQCLSKSQIGLFKGASHVKTTYDKVVWSVKKRGVQRGGDVAEKTMGQLYSKLLCKLALV